MYVGMCKKNILESWCYTYKTINIFIFNAMINLTYKLLCISIIIYYREYNNYSLMLYIP